LQNNADHAGAAEGCDLLILLSCWSAICIAHCQPHNNMEFQFMHNRPLKKLLCAVAAAIGLSASLSASATDPLKVGFVYIGPIGDHGWTYQHEQGRKALAEKFGPQITTNYVENVAEGADAERVIRNMAKDKYDLIFTTSFGYMNPTLKVAKQFPKVTFEHATGYKHADNVGTFLTRSYEGRYVGGFLAAKMTKTK